MKKIIFASIILMLFIQCANETKTVAQDTNVITESDLETSRLAKEEKLSVNRWHITGDFDGDGVIDTLSECFISQIDNKEIHNLPNDIEYDSLVAYVVSLQPKVFLKSDKEKITNLDLADDSQCFGVSWLRNIGDVNGDGTDEISVVMDWADWSNLNSCRIYSLIEGSWEEIDRAQIHESEMLWTENEPPFEGFVSQDENGEYYVSEYDFKTGEMVKRKMKLQ